MRASKVKLKSAPASEPMGDEDQRSFTSWKLDIVNALLSDSRVSHGHFRIAVRVMQAVNAETRIAHISDAVICDELPKTDRFGCNDARKRLEKLKWWTVTRGHGGRASRYIFSDANVDNVLDQRALDRDARQAERARRRREYRRTRRAEGDVVEEPLLDEGDAVQEPHKPIGGRGAATTGDVVEEPPVHRQDTFKKNSSEEELGAYPREGLDEVDWQAAVDERAAILEFDGGLPRAESEAQAREELS